MAKHNIVKKTVYTRRNKGGARKTQIVVRKKHNKRK